MSSLLRPRRFVVLTEGQLGVFDSKTAIGILRYRAPEVVAVLDSLHAGGDLQQLVGVGEGVPIVATLAEAVDCGADTLLIGIAPGGGRMPEEWRDLIRQAIRHGLDVVSGLHLFLNDDFEFRALAEQQGVELVDLRRPPEDLDIAHMEVLGTRALRVLTVGTDCNVGKKVAALELTAAAQGRGWDAVFVPTGQTGVLLAGWGIAIDRVIADFISGAMERLVLEAGDHDLMFIEGQGGILHPAYSGVTLGILHGALPDALVLCHHVGRDHMRRQRVPLPEIEVFLDLYPRLIQHLHPAPVVGVALNTCDLDDEAADRAAEEYRARTGLPAVDPIRHGVEPLLEALPVRRDG